MTDLSKTIAPKSDQLNADDLIGGPLTIQITRVSACPDSAEQPIAINFEGDGGKPYKPCKSMRRVLVQVWGKDGSTFAGRTMTLYRDPEVQFGGMKVGGIRISHMSDIDNPVTMALTATRANRKPYTVKPLASAPKVDVEAIRNQARAAARKGTEAFTAWWQGDGAKLRDHVRPIIPEIQKLAKEGDQAKAEDPFGLPPASDPTPEDLARAEAEALAAIKAQEQEAAE